MKTKFVKDVAANQAYYWIAINGPSAALSPIPAPLARLSVSPVPEQLIGLPTLEEASEVQQACLNAPIEEVDKLMRERFQRADVGKVGMLTPEPPTSGPTVWLFENADADKAQMELKPYRVTLKTEIIYEVDLEAPDERHAEFKACEVSFYPTDSDTILDYMNPDEDSGVISCNDDAFWEIVDFDPKGLREVLSVEELNNGENGSEANESENYQLP